MVGGVAMSSVRTEEMVSKLTASGSLVDFGPANSRLLIKVMRALAAGRPITSEQVNQFVTEIGIAQDEADQFLRAKTERDNNDHIVGILGLSLNDYPHRFTVNETQMTTWCAYDTLYLPVLLQQTATVESPSKLSKKPVRLTVSPTGVQDASPADAVLSMVIIDPDKTDMGSTKAIWGNFCHQIFFFASRQEAEQWAADRDDIEILSVHEGFELGKQMWSKVLAYV